MPRPSPDPAPLPFGDAVQSGDPSDTLVDETLELWTPLSREPLTRADARRIARDVGDFLSVLADWARMDRERSAPDESARERASVLAVPFPPSTPRNR